MGPVGVSWVFFASAGTFSISSFFAGIISDKLVSYMLPIAIIIESCAMHTWNNYSQATV